MSPALPLRFLLSVDDARNLPDSPAEVAVVGRSNVGKSSLVNALGGRNDLARTSKTPGRTRLLNCFAAAGGTLVDCPGYGYAEASKSMRASWQKMIEHYLLEREPLSMAVVLVDGEIGPTRLDLALLEWVARLGAAVDLRDSPKAVTVRGHYIHAHAHLAYRAAIGHLGTPFRLDPDRLLA